MKKKYIFKILKQLQGNISRKMKKKKKKKKNDYKACFTLRLCVASYVSLTTRNALCFEMDYTLQLHYVTN